MSYSLKLASSFLVLASLAGCTTIVEQGPGVCSVHDYQGRNWSAEGPRACRIALHRCQRWHNRYHPNANWACMYN